MKNNPVYTLPNGLTVSFLSVLSGVNGASGALTVHGFTATIGESLTVGAHELAVNCPSVFIDVHAMAEKEALRIHNERYFKALENFGDAFCGAGAGNLSRL